MTMNFYEQKLISNAFFAERNKYIIIREFIHVSSIKQTFNKQVIGFLVVYI